VDEGEEYRFEVTGGVCACNDGEEEVVAAEALLIK
jgi:hypothetical protein